MWYTVQLVCSITLTSLWARWRLKSPASRLFTRPFIQAQIKENIKAHQIHRWPVNSPYKWPVTRKRFPFDDAIMDYTIISFTFLDHETCSRAFKLHSNGRINPINHPWMCFIQTTVNHNWWKEILPTHDVNKVSMNAWVSYHRRCSRRRRRRQKHLHLMT